MNQEVTFPLFTPCRFGKDYVHSEEFKAMRHFLMAQATLQQLEVVWNNLYQVDVEIAEGGKNMGHETIQAHYWLWRKGTPRYVIEELLGDLIAIQKMKEDRRMVKVLAGKTKCYCGETIRITSIPDPEDQCYIGCIGRITHPFPGLMQEGAGTYIAGVELSPGFYQSLPNGVINLMEGDTFEVLDASTAYLYPASLLEEEQKR